MATKKELQKFLRTGGEETGPLVGVRLPEDVNKALVIVQAEYGFKEKPTKEELVIAAVRMGLGLKLPA